MKFLKAHPFFFVISLFIIIFITYNLIKESRVERIEQSNTPSVAVVEEFIEGNNDQQRSEVVIGEAMFSDGKSPYNGSGSAKIIEIDGTLVLTFDETFSTTNGPDLQVYLSPNEDAKNQGLGEFVTLGELKKQNGSQVYSLPDNFKTYSSVVVWCRAFQGVFTQAKINYSE